jgi:hypothetical protein
MYPRRTEYFLEAFARATARPHGYMVIDMKQNTPDILRLRTFIFPVLAALESGGIYLLRLVPSFK